MPSTPRPVYEQQYVSAPASSSFSALVPPSFSQSSSTPSQPTSAQDDKFQELEQMVQSGFSAMNQIAASVDRTNQMISSLQPPPTQKDSEMIDASKSVFPPPPSQ